MATVQLSYCNPPANVGDFGSVEQYCANPYNLTLMAIELPALEALQQAPGAAIPNLDPADVATVFGVAFSIVVLFFLVGRGVGSVLSLIRRG